ncbi:N5-hydroxyornithine acetyltransferase [Microdochium nivale]|nr:N5-hydroxyornithine acetyltransferase [Microdochium nivale]
MLHWSYTAAASPASPPSSSSSFSLAAALILTALSSFFVSGAHASVLVDRKDNYYDPAPAAAALARERAYLPAQIGGIVGSYAFSLIVVAACLLTLAKKRREHLTAGEADPEDIPYPFPNPYGVPQGVAPGQYQPFPYPPETPREPATNFSYPTSPRSKDPGPYVFPPPLSTSTLGVNQSVDQRVVALDRVMAQNQLEDMYKYVMEQDAAKQAGITLDRPPSALSPGHAPAPSAKHDSIASQPKSILKKARNKPANLDLERGSEKPQSRASSLLSALKSPRKSKSIKAISISSPIMTPMSGTFPRYQESQEMSAIPPRHYQPSAPPPVPVSQVPYYNESRHHSHAAPVTPPDDRSPQSTMSIDERLEKLNRGHSRSTSLARSEVEPDSAVTERSNAPLVGLPSSPKPSVTRFPTLPASPRPGASFASTPRAANFPTSPAPGSAFALTPKPGSSFRSNAPSAIRTGGGLPLRAYEPSLVSPSSQTTKQTTFERPAPLSPSMQGPWTGAPQPYTPYQPFSPVIPMTPSLVTRADRKRMKHLMPKTPTVEMVQSSEDIW